MNKSKVVLGALAGIAVGAVSGVLFAPKKGSATRKKIKDKSNDFVDNIKAKYGDLLGTLSKKLERTKDDAENLAEKAKDTFDDAKKEVKNSATNFKHDVATNNNGGTL